MESRPWYVITGGPCAGKSALIDELQRRKYDVVPEAARALIETHLTTGKTLAEIRADEAAFQRALIPLKVRAEEKAPLDKTVFLDRGMHDSIVYLSRAGVPSDPTLTAALAGTSYRKVFLLDLLPFETDRARTEDEASAKDIHEALGKVYRDAGFEVVRVPVLPVPERADFVLKNL